MDKVKSAPDSTLATKCLLKSMSGKTTAALRAKRHKEPY
jgi:hypothetical protein